MLNKEHILAVATALEQEHDGLKLNMEYVADDGSEAAKDFAREWTEIPPCGSTVCMCGMSCILKGVSFSELKKHDFQDFFTSKPFNIAMYNMGIERSQAEKLFTAYDIGADVPRAVRVLRHLAETGEVDLDPPQIVEIEDTEDHSPFEAI